MSIVNRLVAERVGYSGGGVRTFLAWRTILSSTSTKTKTTIALISKVSERS
ncbi:hypothetical protein ACFLTB_07370 [Chloroflexota bacterium]